MNQTKYNILVWRHLRLVKVKRLAGDVGMLKVITGKKLVSSAVLSPIRDLVSKTHLDNDPN